MCTVMMISNGLWRWAFPRSMPIPGKECHLDAHLVEHAIDHLPLDNIDILFIENVGNMVCPTDFRLGAEKRIVVVSSTEGDDVVNKHPMMFRDCTIGVINKVDLAPRLVPILTGWSRISPGITRVCRYSGQT